MSGADSIDFVNIESQTITFKMKIFFVLQIGFNIWNLI